MGIDSNTMKEWNKYLVRKQLKQMHSATKPELSRQTGLSVVTVNALVTEMIQDGEVLSGREIPSGGGRPSMQYHYHANYALAAVIYGHWEQGRNLVQMQIVNLYGECLLKKQEYLDQVEVESFDLFLQEVFREYPGIRLIAFGLPGEEENGIITINDYQNIVGDRFLRHYKDTYQVPVIFENDANAAIFGYYLKQGRMGNGNAACIYMPRKDGPGAGILFAGEIHHGQQNFAGEIGHMDFSFSWKAINFQDTEQVSSIVGWIAVIYGCILAPEYLVLYGDFWTSANKEAVLDYWKRRIPENVQMELIFSEEFSEDFARGMIGLGIEEMERQMMPEGRKIL